MQTSVQQSDRAIKQSVTSFIVHPKADDANPNSLQCIYIYIHVDVCVCGSDTSSCKLMPGVTLSDVMLEDGDK